MPVRRAGCGIGPEHHKDGRAEKPPQHLWAATIHPALPNGGQPSGAEAASRSLVVVERSFAAPTPFDDVQAIEDAARACFDQHDVRPLTSYFALDRRRKRSASTEAPDTELVRSREPAGGYALRHRLARRYDDRRQAVAQAGKRCRAGRLIPFRRTATIGADRQSLPSSPWACCGLPSHESDVIRITAAANPSALRRILVFLRRRARRKL